MESGREPRELKPGDVLGRYQLLMPIAKGGMGQVWAARQSGTRGFQKLVAVKTILPSNEDAGQLESMLFDEASLASLVRHPNVAETLDLGEQDGTLYLVMEWVNGEPLDYILRASRAVGGIPIAIAVHLIVQACKGLHAAHEAKNSKGEHLGIVHRDISPQNLLVTYSGVVKLVDFGVAKATHQMSQPTALGQVKGKFAYMSPEQVHGETLDGRADVFAMGIVLYRITTGKHPFKSDNPAATIHNILTTGPELPSELVPGYPKRLEEVVMKALARDRAERFDSAHEMMLALEQALPTAVRAHSDKNTEVFLHRLFEQRIAERAATLRAALDDADAGTELSTPARQVALPRSQSTMRAVSVESIGEDVHFHSSILPPAPQVPSLRATGRLTRALVATLAAAATLVLATSASRLLHRAEGGLIGDATKGVVTGGAAA
ncbi:MAG TPA: serine/threonine-protein kinase, partial [Polyangiaceae bacterium]|nr:serine/threonine-protein kinase [Polyangiaceae bacterium]